VEIWLLRHGRSRADDEGKVEGRYDSPLTDMGRQQAQALATRWSAQGLTFDAILCSTLQRARETAEIIGAELQVGIEPDPDWMEIDNGPLAGLPLAEAEDRFPLPGFINPYAKLAGEGESPWDLHCRAVRALQRVVRKESGRYLVVAHGGILNAAARAIVGASPPVNDSGVTFAFGDTGFLRAAYDPCIHRWTIQAFEHGV
jgi:2,3-bisphosphoglycerate-dependent phosphoglycerate mutase